MEKIVNIQGADPNNFQLQDYSPNDESLIASYIQQDIVFNPVEDYLEYYIFDLNKNILFSNVSGWPNYSLLDNNLTIDPQRDLEAQGFDEGEYYTLYNFLKRKLSSTSDDTFYIQEISSDRTELRLNTTLITNVDVIDLVNEFIAEINSSLTYRDFYLNFGNNKLIIANNIVLDNDDPNDPQILIKLYEPLPSEFDINSQCWIVEQVAESLAYNIVINLVFDDDVGVINISGPNFNLDFQDQINNSTPYYNLNLLNQNTSLLGSGSLLYQINSILAEKGIEINIDYSDYSQFIHFSSAQTRLENFYYKLALIEEYNYSASLSNNTVNNIFISNSQFVWQNKINDIITNFDGYEYYLYYDSGSDTWPKTNSVYPYINASVNSAQGINWLTGQLDSASYYDSENKDALINTIPSYLREDNSNQQYFLFTHMVGQHFDNIWIYLKDITNKFDADNRINYGISKDIVAQAIRDLGVKIYQNNFSTNDLYSSLLGITPSGSLFNIPNITGSFPVPSGSGLEYITTVVTASSTSSLIPIDDINKEIYKRIYHNLPILLKKKGTTEGLKMLLDIYGIPDTILRVNEFGGKSYQNQSWDNFVDQFNYSFYSEGTGYISASLAFTLAGTKSPRTLQFRFKTNGIPSSSIPYREILYHSVSHSIYLEYTGSGYTSGSYSGSIPNLYNEYATLVYYDGDYPVSCSVYLPFYDGNWWSIMVNTNSTNASYLYAKNKIYTGYDGSAIGFEASSSCAGTWNAYPGIPIYLSYSSSTSINGVTCYPFSGSFQEWRMYYYGSTNQYLNEESFDDYVMNPYSIEGNSLTGSLSSLNTLFFRAPLGTILDNDISQTTRISIHPAISLIPPTQSFNSNNSNYILGGTFSFEPNTEIIYQDQFTSGVKNSVSEKIRIVSMSLPPGNVLSQYISIQQNSSTIEQFTDSVNYFEAAFSPQDEINDDIIAQLGSFNLGSYIGDPRHLITGSLNYYPDFNKLRDYYFSKYIHNYNLNDYIRLIKFYDNSLFKMIKDFTPARTGLASGIVIKGTLLERNRYPQPKVNTTSTLTFVGSPVSRSLNIFY